MGIDRGGVPAFPGARGWARQLALCEGPGTMTPPTNSGTRTAPSSGNATTRGHPLRRVTGARMCRLRPGRPGHCLWFGGRVFGVERVFHCLCGGLVGWWVGGCGFSWFGAACAEPWGRAPGRAGCGRVVALPVVLAAGVVPVWSQGPSWCGPVVPATRPATVCGCGHWRRGGFAVWLHGWRRGRSQGHAPHAVTGPAAG